MLEEFFFSEVFLEFSIALFLLSLSRSYVIDDLFIRRLVHTANVTEMKNKKISSEKHFFVVVD